jgi:hypothetical protein
MNPIVAGSIAFGLFVVEQSALWGATLWNMRVSYIEVGARLILPSYEEVRPPTR